MVDFLDTSSTYIKKINGFDFDDKKRLDICIPIVKTYQFLAFPLSIVCFHDNVEGWFYSNFINTYSKFTVENGSVDFRLDYNVNFYDDRPYYLGKETLGVDTFNKLNKNTVEEFIEFIIDDKYICVFLDEYFITYSYNYRNNHYIHDVMIIGYDLKKESFICLGYGSNGQYEIRDLLFKDFLLAWNSDYHNQYSQILLFRWINHEDHYIFDFNFLADSIKTYLQGDDILKCKKHLFNNIYSEGFVYGINMFNTLKEYINFAIKKTEYSNLRVIPFYNVNEHKVCMLKRFIFLCDKGFIESEPDVINSYKSVLRNSSTLLNLVLKYNNIRNIDMKLLYRIIEKIDEIKEEEIALLNSFLYDIKHLL